MLAIFPLNAGSVALRGVGGFAWKGPQPLAKGWLEGGELKREHHALVYSAEDLCTQMFLQEAGRSSAGVGSHVVAATQRFARGGPHDAAPIPALQWNDGPADPSRGAIPMRAEA